MRRLFATLVVWAILISTASAQTAATAPASTQNTATQATTTQATTTQAAGPATTQSTQPASRPSTRAGRQNEAEKKESDKRRAEVARLNGLLNDISGSADDAANTIRTIQTRFSASNITSEVDHGLPVLMDQIGSQLDENSRLLASAPSLETLRSLEAAWAEPERSLSGWLGDLSRRDEVLSDGQHKLDDLQTLWQTRRDTAKAISSNPEDVEKAISRIDQLIEPIGLLQDNLNWEHDRLNNLQITMRNQQIRVRDSLAALNEAETRARDKLLQQDSPPLWNALLNPSAQANVAEQGRNSFGNQWRLLINYLQTHRTQMLLHGAGVLALAAVLVWLRRQTRQWTANDPSLLAATRVFQTPIATALTASMILTPWIYISAPRLFWGILGTAALLPTIMVLRPLIERSLRPLLYGLAGAIFVNLLLSVVAALPIVYRGLFLVQMGGATVFFLWFLRTGKGVPGDPQRPPLRKAAVIGARFGLAVTVVASVANIFGFVSVARLIGNALLTSAYLGVLLDTSVFVVDALLLGASHLKPISTLGMVQRHRPLLLKRTHVLLVLLAIGLWGYFTLESLSIRQPLIAASTTVWNWPRSTAETAIAATQPATAETLLTVGGVISFIITVAASIYVSRFIAFLLDEDVYPRLHLARGMPYAISTLLRYVILAIGFSLAIVKLGYGDPTKLTILVSAFSIGLGFGLQNIVNNFVSGLILLFERPVQVGDVIELDNVTGVVSRIGIRASVIRTPLAAEIIVPNGRLISDRVVNWTLSNRQRGIELPLTVAPGTDPQQMIKLLIATAKAHPLVAAYPAPQAYFTEFSGGGMKFEVRCWTNRFEDWSCVRSEVAMAINAALLKDNIQLK
ncbi:MAG: putative Mechanosensitive ion channel [Phycisphaerales bacterium]|nr:putative Mechanosensitive ion channel [Phycisphaerales bacterium]